MSSIAEQITDAIFDALYNAVPAVGTRVYRARQDAIPREECPAIVVEMGAEESTVATLAGDVSRCDVTVNVSVHVADGDPWETEADTVATAAHALIAAATLPGTATSITDVLITSEAQSGDATPGIRTHSYTVSFYRSFASLDAAA